MKIMVINGPNLNKLGLRDEKHYGSPARDELKKMIIEKNQQVLGSANQG